MPKFINVGMSQIEISSGETSVLSAPGLGSCIALAAYDPENKTAGMAHIVLPDSEKLSDKKEIIVGKCADTAVPELLKRLSEAGAVKSRLIVKMAGGSQMFNFNRESNVLNIGIRNIIAVRAALSKEGIIVKKADTGGNKGRTFKLDTQTGRFSVKIIGQDEFEI